LKDKGEQVEFSPLPEAIDKLNYTYNSTISIERIHIFNLNITLVSQLACPELAGNPNSGRK
jgi:hypothetical protein